MINIYLTAGILGLIIISIGVLLKRREKEDLFFIIGGIFLLVYSYYLNNYVFIILQLVFIIVSVFDFRKRFEQRIERKKINSKKRR